MRQTKGGGIRTETFSNESTLTDVLDRRMQFFSSRKTPFGELNSMEVGIDTHKDVIIDIDYNKMITYMGTTSAKHDCIFYIKRYPVTNS